MIGEDKNNIKSKKKKKKKKKKKVFVISQICALLKQSAPQDFWPGNFCWPIGEKEARKKWEKRGGKREEKKAKEGKL